MTTELTEFLNNEQVTYVCKVIPQKDEKVLILLNNLTIENVLHKKYNILVESAVHIHRKIFDSYYMMSRIPVTVPASLSHPFREGLTSLVNLKKFISGNDQAQKYFNIVKNSLVRISGVSLNVQYLLPTISHQEVKLNFSEFFKQYVFAKVERIKDSYLSPITIEWNLESPVLQKDYHMDPNKLSDAIVNVIANGLESVFEECMNDIPTVVVDAYIIGEEGAELISIEVTDNGMHLAPDIKKKMFSPFFSGFEEVGLGLGLTNAKRCIEDHGGDIRFSSKYIDGNRFQIRLPLDDNITLNQIKSKYRHIHFLTEDINTRLVINNYLKVSGIKFSTYTSKKDFIQGISSIDNKDCLLIEYDESYEEFLVKLKEKKPSLGIVLLIKIQQYSSFLKLNERIRIKDVVIYPPTYDLILKSILK